MTKAEFVARAIEDLPKARAKKRKRIEDMARAYMIDAVRDTKNRRRRKSK